MGIEIWSGLKARDLGRPKIGTGKSKSEDGKWKTEKWKTENGKWKTEFEKQKNRKIEIGTKQGDR